jgi:hypothetical protein
MTESSSLTATTILSPRNDFENDIIEIPLSFDIQSQHPSSIDTNINSSSNVSNSFFIQLNHLLV